jgi:Ca2+-binding EF-hand superfamily protein
MKLLKIALIIGLLVFVTCPDNNKNSKINASKSILGAKEKTQSTKSMEKNIETLFKVEDTQEGECKGLDLEDAESSSRIPRPGAEYRGNIPQVKDNPWKNYGKGEAAFLFDHLDFLLKSKLVEKFKKIYEKCSKIPYVAKFDPYTTEVLMQELVQGRDFSQGLAPYIKNFNKDAYDKGLSVGQVTDCIHQNKWNFEVVVDFAKKSFDKFDFNGDGRLDIWEFILFSIIHNKPIYGRKECVVDACYDDIFDEIIDPMFHFFDCDRSGTINAEEIWKGLKLLKKPDKKYSIFNCKLKLDMEKDYRTISVNDFILLNSVKTDGFLDIDEFRSGLLLGYWNRQVAPWEIDSGVKYVKADDRWDGEGKEDKMCGKIKVFLPDNWKKRKEDSLKGVKK